MKLKINKESNALYRELDDSPAEDSEEISPGVILDYNSQGMVTGIEMLYLAKRVSSSQLRKVEVSSGLFLSRRFRRLVTC